jgi:hypothetical protein
MGNGFTDATRASKQPSSIAEIDLLRIESTVRERELRDRMLLPGAVLTFNARSIQSITIGVLATSRRRLAVSLGVRRHEVKMDRVSVAAYHAEEQALYIAMNFDLAVQSSSTAPGYASVGTLVRAGPLSKQLLTEVVSVCTCEMILEFMDCIDLIRFGLAVPAVWRTVCSESFSNLPPINGQRHQSI